MSDEFRWELSSVEELTTHFDLDKSGELDSAGLTPLAWSILYQRWDLGQKLLANGTDPNISCQDGIGALHMLFVKYSPNMYSLPNFRPSYYYVYTEGISPLCLVVEQDQIPQNFVESLVEHNAQLLPDCYMMTGLTFARMARLPNDIKLLQDHLGLSVRDVVEGPLLQSVSISMDRIPNTYLTSSLKHGLLLPDTCLLHSWDTAKTLAEKHLVVLEKIKDFYLFPSLPLKLYLNVPYTALTHQYNAENATPEEEVALFKVFNIYLQMVVTDYPPHFFKFFSDDALKIANKELRIIYLFLSHLQTFLETQYTASGDIEWFNPIDHLFDTNYTQLFQLDVKRDLDFKTEKGEGFVNRLVMILTQVNVYCKFDSRLEACNGKWVDALNTSICRIMSLLSIVILYSHTQFDFDHTSRLIKFLLTYGTNVNERDRNTLRTCLHTVVEINDPKLFLFMLDRNAYVFTVDKEGLTPHNLIDMRYPENKAAYDCPKLTAPFPLKSLAAQTLSEHAKLSDLLVGHQESQIAHFLQLHYNSC